MPIFAALLEQLVGGLVAYFAKQALNKALQAVAVLAITTALFAGAYAALKGVWAGLGLVLPASLSAAFMMVKPTHFDAIIAAYFTGRVIIAGYKWSVATARALASSTAAPATGQGSQASGS